MEKEVTRLRSRKRPILESIYRVRDFIAHGSIDRKMIQGLAERRIMNYIAEINAFEQWLESNHLSANSQLLWYKFMQRFNKANWQKWIQVDNLRLMAAMQMSSEKTLIKCRDELMKAGLIAYQKGKKGCKYRLIPFVAENTVNNTVRSTVEKEVKTEVNDTVESSAIYKQNKNNKKKDTNVSKEKMVSAANNRFIPPTLEEVQAYCQERGNKVDAEQFVNFYSAKGWYVGKNKMKDWKAVISSGLIS